MKKILILIIAFLFSLGAYVSTVQAGCGTCDAENHEEHQPTKEEGSTEDSTEEPAEDSTEDSESESESK